MLTELQKDTVENLIDFNIEQGGVCTHLTLVEHLLSQESGKVNTGLFGSLFMNVQLQELNISRLSHFPSPLHKRSQ